MNDTAPTTTAPITRALEAPPRSTGNPAQDYPILIDWVYKAFQVINQAVGYINNQVQENPDFDITNLPNPATSTIAQAQNTANQAYVIADGADDKADALDTRMDTAEADIDALQGKFAALLSGDFTITDANVGVLLTWATPQPDTNYKVIIQPVSITGTPAANAYIVATKTYNTADFSATMLAAPGVGNSITYEYQLIRN
jgi:hypothetical protein